MKNRLLLLFSFLALAKAIAQIGYTNQEITNFDNQVDGFKSFKTVDIDGDDDLDVIVSSSHAGLFWYENIDGKGTYSKIKTISSANWAQFNFADIDKDKDIDVITNDDGIGLVWYEYDSVLKKFSRRHVIDPTEDFRELVGTIEVNDFDGDGFLDIITSSRYNHQGNDSFTLFLNKNGQGDFTKISYNIILSKFDHKTSGDIDNDGDIDFLFGNEWYENTDSQGTFKRFVDRFKFSGHDGYAEITIVDINKDGNKDIVGLSNDNLFWYENIDSNGVFSDIHILDDTPKTNDHRYFTVDDVDNDGYIDILFAYSQDLFLSPTKNEFLFYKNNNGSGDFQKINLTNEDLQDVNSLGVGDVDNDGIKDVIVHNQPSGLTWHRSSSSFGNFSSRLKVAQHLSNIYKSDAPFTELLYKDVNTDGIIDIVGYSAFNRNRLIFWLEGIGNGNYKQVERLVNVDASLWNLNIADIDNDGDNDLIYCSKRGEGKFINILKNLDGFGSFDRNMSYKIDDFNSNESSFFHINSVVDLDNDGDNDVLGSHKDFGLFWYQNMDGLGTFSSKKIIDPNTKTAGFFTQILIGDLDNDNNNDIVIKYIANSDDKHNVSWYKNQGNATSFSSEQILYTYNTQKSNIYLGNIDNDGILDIGISMSNSRRSGNGRGDIINLTWLKKESSQENFSEVKTIRTFSDVTMFKAETYFGDIDDDGDIDVLFPIVKDIEFKDPIYKLVWLENVNGLGDFGSEQIIRNGFEKQFDDLYLEDINKDGKTDIFYSLGKEMNLLKSEGIVSNEINGFINLDSNNNGCDSNDLKIANTMVTADDGINTYSTFTEENGLYQLFVGSGDYSISIDSKLPNYYTSTPNSYEVNLNGNNTIFNGEFCLEKNQDIEDVSVVLLPITEARPGFDVTYQIVYENLGTTITQGSIDFLFDELLQGFITSSETPEARLANKLSFNFDNLVPFESRTIDITLNTKPPDIVNGDDILNLEVNITSNNTDKNKENNLFSLDQIVVNSFDPNDKLVLEGDKIDIDDLDKYLHYVIRFQNIGTASAINVRIDDILSNNLNWNSFKPLSASHDYRVEVINEQYVKFLFDNINLPDTNSDEPNSHGFVSFKIKPIHDLGIGDIIENKASIYFDFNKAIITNTSIVEIVDDDDNDGVMNNVDECPNTPIEEIVDAKGCSESQKDDDNDGISNANDLCPNTNEGNTVNSSGCFFLSAKNFTIKTIGETCPDKNNAKIIITANETYDYVASFNGVDYNFTTDLTIDNLRPGNYDLCITVASESYKQCYTITLAEGITISGKSSSDKSGKVSIDIDNGTAPYSISINGHVVSQTESSSFSVNASHGDLIEISTSKACEGKLSKKVHFTNVILAHPNPTSTDIEINLPISQKEVIIDLYTIQSQLISTNKYSIINGKVNLSLAKQPKGIYFVKLYIEEPIILKIIKK